MAGRLFAFDLGTTSIGWAVFDLGPEGNPDTILDAGVRIFADGREPKSGNSLAEGRRMARAMSRRRDRYKRRRKAVLRTLTEFGLMPADAAGRQALVRETGDRAAGISPATDVYSLRARALAEPLALCQIGRALFHLNQRRGFKSNRKTDRRSNEKGAIETGVHRLREKMTEAGAPTLGAFLAMRRASGEWVRVRAGAVDAAEGGSVRTAYDFYPDRELLEEEFNAIWAEQSKHHPELMTEERRAHLFRVMFYQRPLKAGIVGKCSFNPSEARLARAHPLFQRFRLLKEVNELEITFADQSRRRLTRDERDALVLKLSCQRKATYASLRKTLKLPRDARFNKESDNRTDMLGDEVSAALAVDEVFGPRWRGFSLERRWAIVERLREEEDPLELHAWLVGTQGLDDSHAGAAANVHLPEGYARLGQTALAAMVEELEADVIPEAEAAKRAGYDHALARRGGDGADHLPKYQEVLDRRIPPGTGEPADPYDVAKGRITNPTVHIALNQLRRVANALVRRYGKPAQIAVELARALKLNDREKARVNRQIGENTRAAERRSQKLRELGQADNGHNRVLLKLWEELNPERPEDRACVYSGAPITIGMLFSGAVDVDHILPWSRTLDDSQGNRILCTREANRVKGNRAPAEVTEWSAGYDAVLERAARLPSGKAWRFARDAMEKFEAERDFLARQLTDTQYLSRLAHEYLASLYPDEEPDEWGVFERRNHVRVVPGRLTEMLRRNWGLNPILPDHNFAGAAQAKNRSDHRHHAIDAAVVGVTTRSLLQNISREAGRREAAALEETVARIPQPWPTFRDELKAIVGRIIVSHKPDRGTLPKTGKPGATAGRLHNDTAYGITGETDAKGNTIVVRRKSFLSLREGDLSEIRDAELRQRLEEATYGLTGKDFAAALDRFRRTDTRFGRIRRVRVTEPLAVIPIRGPDGAVYKGYKGDANYRYDVWELRDGRWVAEVLSMFDAHRAGWTSAVRAGNPTARKVLSLQQGDMVAYDHPSNGPTIGLVTKFGQNGQITLIPHNEGGDLKRRDAAGDDPFKYYAPTAGGLKKIGLRQIRIDEIGRVWDPGPRHARVMNGGAD